MAVYRSVAERIVEVYNFDWKDNVKMKETCICSVESVISNIVNVTLVVFVAGIMGSLGEALIFIGTFVAMRFYAGGAHARSHVRCILTYLCVLIASIICAKYCTLLPDIYINSLCGCSVIIAMAINYKYAARQRRLGQRTPIYRRKLKRIWIAICFIMGSVCFIYSHVSHDTIRECLQKVVLLQAFAILAQSIALWIERGECKEGGEGNQDRSRRRKHI